MKLLGSLVAVVAIAALVWLLTNQLTGRNEPDASAIGISQNAAKAAGISDDEQCVAAAIGQLDLLPTGDDGDAHLPDSWRGVPPWLLHVYAIQYMEAEVHNGGLWQFFYNAPADVPAQALAGFRALGATDYANLLDQAIDLFPGGVLPATRTARIAALPGNPDDYESLPPDQRQFVDQLSELDEAYFDLYGDGNAYYKMLADYIRAQAKN